MSSGTISRRAGSGSRSALLGRLWPASLGAALGQDGTEWAIAAFPLGGYVKMLDEREGEVPAEELHRSFNRQPVLRRMVIVAAGPAANFLLAIVLYWGLFWYGTEEFKPFSVRRPSRVRPPWRDWKTVNWCSRLAAKGPDLAGDALAPVAAGR
jgi:membrane-associated protease RseP (regulator of RpoE activity)